LRSSLAFRRDGWIIYAIAVLAAADAIGVPIECRLVDGESPFAPRQQVERS
jgi:hypothetical protein